jgi:hypothetical protein
MARCQRPSEKQVAWLAAIEKKLARAFDPQNLGKSLLQLIESE